MPRALQWIRCSRCSKIATEIFNIDSHCEPWPPVEQTLTTRSLRCRGNGPQEEKDQMEEKLARLLQPLLLQMNPGEHP